MDLGGIRSQVQAIVRGGTFLENESLTYSQSDMQDSLNMQLLDKSVAHSQHLARKRPLLSEVVEEDSQLNSPEKSDHSRSVAFFEPRDREHLEASPSLDPDRLQLFPLPQALASPGPDSEYEEHSPARQTVLTAELEGLCFYSVEGEFL